MKAFRTLTAITVLSVSAIALANHARATTTVPGWASIYDAESASITYGTSSLPPSISLPAGTTSVTFSNVAGNIACSATAGCITVNGNANFNDPDGHGAAVATTTVTSAANFSGIILPSGALAGLFTNGVPVGPAPATLDFSGAGGTGFSALSPLLNQVFFIGDGLTGDGSGSVQSFHVPTGATTLWLGLADASSYSGSPGAYSDNFGSYSVDVGGLTAAVPEPASLAILGAGLVGTGLIRRRRAARPA